MTDHSKRFLAAAAICTGAESVKRRLDNAWLGFLHDLDPRELPTEIQPDFHALREAMHTATPQPHENAASASIRKMSDAQAAVYTATILDLATSLLQLAPASSGQSQPVAELIFDRNYGRLRQLN